MIPVCEPTLSGNELNYVVDCVKTGWISSQGKYVNQFEERFAAFCNSKHAITCSSGFAALHLALEALHLKPGDEVIVPTFTMAATINAVICAGAKPVLVDSELETWNIDTNKIEEKITENTKVIMPVHMYGHPCEMDEINEIAQKHNLVVVDDAAEAMGAEYKGNIVGSLCKISCFSLYANKIITTGEGGMIVTNSEEIADEIRSLKDHAFGTPRFFHKRVGFNYRMSNLIAAIGVAQMERVNELVQSRIDNANYYNQLLEPLDCFDLPPKKEHVKNVYWMYGVLVKKSCGISKEQFMQKLKEKGVDTRSFFYPMHLQPAYIEKTRSNVPETNGSYPVSEDLFERGFYLPSGSSLTKEQIETVVSKISEILTEHNV